MNAYLAAAASAARPGDRQTPPGTAAAGGRKSSHQVNPFPKKVNWRQAKKSAFAPGDGRNTTG
jgi:hypothetical protein